MGLGSNELTAHPYIERTRKEIVMENEKVKVVSKGLSLSSILTIIFVIAKLFGVINWSWWLVLLPSLISLGLWVLIIVVVLIIVIIGASLE